MKFILENYASESTTEPMYFTECLNRAGCETALWNPGEISAFDIYDMVSPDVMVANLSSITIDLFKVLRGKSNTELVVNVSGASQDEILALEAATKSNGINCSLIFGDKKAQYKTGLKFLHVLKGADVFLGNQVNTIPDYTIDKAFIIEEDNEISHAGCYHIVGLSRDVKCDIAVPISAFYQLCKNYKEIIIKKTTTDLSQFFFDTHFYGNNVSIETEGKNKAEIDKVLNSHFDGDVQRSIKTKHTCIRRVARWLQKLGCKDEAVKVRNIKAVPTSV
jgi:hypothetical protein